MADILELLFDEYTKKLFFHQKKEMSKDAQTRYQQLQDLAGTKLAIEIWDAAAEEGAAMQDACYQAGVKTGILLLLELLSV